MSKKKHKVQNNNCSNTVSHLKIEFKNIIDKMSDREFIDFVVNVLDLSLTSNNSKERHLDPLYDLDDDTNYWSDDDDLPF